MGCVRKNNLLIIVNIFVVCLGVTVMGTAGVLIHRHNKLDVVLTNVYYAVPLNSLLTGISLALRCCLGCCGAIKGSPLMLTLFVMVMGLILVAAIVLLVFTYNATNFLTDGMTEVYNQYGEEGKEELTHHLDDFQHEGQCCGINGYEDWADFPYRNGTSVADGCCKEWTEGCGVGMLNNPNVTHLVWSDGCLDYVYDVFAVICFALAILSFILVGLQTLSIALACVLDRDSFEYIQF